MTLTYINGDSKSQTELAEDMDVNISSGVPISTAAEYLNNNQNNANYTQIWPDTTSEMQGDFYDIMNDENAPAIISTTFTKGDGYPYTMTYPHALCVTGQTANGATFRLYDPILNANVPESYYVKADKIMEELKSYIA